MIAIKCGNQRHAPAEIPDARPIFASAFSLPVLRSRATAEVDSLQPLLRPPNPTKSGQIRPNQTKSNQIKPNQTKKSNVFQMSHHPPSTLDHQPAPASSRKTVKFAHKDLSF